MEGRSSLNWDPDTVITAELVEEEPAFPEVLRALLHSRKVLLALVGVIQTLVLHYANVPPEVWAAIDTLLLAVIAGIAHEDAAEKR